MTKSSVFAFEHQSCTINGCPKVTTLGYAVIFFGRYLMAGTGSINPCVFFWGQTKLMALVQQKGKRGVLNSIGFILQISFMSLVAGSILVCV